MRNMSVFQIIILSVFGVFAVGGLLIFAGVGGFSDSSGDIGTVLIWGTLSGQSFNSVLATLAEDNDGLRNVAYVQKDSRTYNSDLTEALASGGGPDLGRAGTAGAGNRCRGLSGCGRVQRAGPEGWTAVGGPELCRALCGAGAGGLGTGAGVRRSKAQAGDAGASAAGSRTCRRQRRAGHGWGHCPDHCVSGGLRAGAAALGRGHRAA